MKNEIIKLISDLKEEINPTLKADEISHFIIEALRQNKISLYESYVLNWEVVKFIQLGYLQPGWGGSVRITTCIFFLNQKLLSHIFDNGIIIDNINMIALKAYSLNREKRKHYIMDEYDNYLNASNNCQLLNELLKVRINYNNMNSNQGPFHNEVYPYDFYILEKILLNDDEINYYKNNKQLSEEIISLIVDLNQM